MEKKPRLIVDMIADPVCPWCYVGLKSFFTARTELAKDFEVVTRFRPYLLNPDTPKEGVDRQAYYDKKFPDQKKRAAMTEALVKTASEAGFDFDHTRVKHLPNSIDAHRTLRWAHFKGAHEDVALKIYEAFWDEGRNIGDKEVLSEIGAYEEPAREQLANDLDSDKDVDLIRMEARQFSEAGVNGVPTFIVNEVVGFSGAMPPIQLEQGIRQAAHQAAQSPSPNTKAE